jgi:hypothetical protein
MEVALTTAASCPQGADKKFTPPGGTWTGGGPRARGHVGRKFLGPIFRCVNYL